MKAGMTIRRATKADIGAIMNIESVCFPDDAFSRRQITYLVSAAKGIFYVADAGGVIAGYISLLVSERNNSGRIYSIAVDPRYRGEGIAGILIGEVIGYGVKKDLRAIFLEVRTDNVPAIALYEKYGFVKRFVKRGYYEDGGDAYSMAITSPFT